MPANVVARMRTSLEKLRKWFEFYMEPALEYMRKNCKEVIPTLNNNLCQSLQRCIKCLIAPFVETEIKKVAPEEMDLLEASFEYIFHFSLVWSLLSTVDYDGRLKLDKFHRS
jgi:dynein heavy chain